MISEPISCTVNAEVYSLARQNQDNFSAVYGDVSADGQRHLTLSVKHTIPSKTGGSESHLFRLDEEVYDTDKTTLLRKNRVWVVAGSTDGVQNDTDLVNLFTGMVGTLQASTNLILGKVLNRES